MGIQSNYLLAMSITPCDILRFDSFKDINKGDGTVEIMTIEEKVNISTTTDDVTLITNTNTTLKVTYLQQIPFFKKWELYDLHQLAVVILTNIVLN